MPRAAREAEMRARVEAALKAEEARKAAEKAEKDQQLGVMHARMELLRTETEEEKENLRTARQREAQMAATGDEERRAAEQAREWGESVQQDAEGNLTPSAAWMKQRHERRSQHCRRRNAASSLLLDIRHEAPLRPKNDDRGDA